MNPTRPQRVVGVCSWSLQPGSVAELIRDVQALGLSAVQLALDPLRDGSWPADHTAEQLRAAGIAIRSGMLTTVGEDYSALASIRQTGGLRPDVHWATNLERAQKSAGLARRLGLPLVTLHAGFLPPDSNDPLHRTMIERLGTLAAVFDAQGIWLGLETGQESAETLLATIGALGAPNVGVNFDPANMVLYGMGDPIAAFRRLAPHVVQIHIKDARPATESGNWGEEVVVGAGAVDWPRFFAALAESGLPCDLMIEREAGTQRCADIGVARDIVRRWTC